MLVHNCNIKTEKELLESLKASDKEAFASLYQLHAPFLVNFAASRLASLDEARDMIQDIFTSLWEKRASLDINTSLKSYLFTAVRHRIIDQIRKNITRREYATMVQQLADAVIADTEEAVHAKKIERHLEVAMETLPARTKQIYRLSRHKHLAIKEIAGELGISEQTVKNQLSNAVQHLRLSWSKLVSLIVFFTTLMFY